jgi:hypothetical protein
VQSEPQSEVMGLSLPNLGTAIQWLSEHGVKSARLARALGTNVQYIRVLRHRARPLRFNTPAPSLDIFLKRPDGGIRGRLHVRRHEDAVVYSDKAARRIDDFEQEIDQIRDTFGRSGEFFQGLERLRIYESVSGYPASAKWFRFLARLNQHRAWFHTHSGMSTSAFQLGKIAMDFSDLAYRESGDPLDLRRLTEATLVASHACLLVSDPTTCLKLLDIAAAASKRISDPFGSEHYRQRGTAYFELQPEDLTDARRQFKEATAAMERKQEHRNQGQLLMMGARHIALLSGPDVDSSASIMDQVKQDFAPSSLEYAMMLNWTAASALATDSALMHSYAKDLLRDSLVRSQPYGHQSTRARLLALTTEVGLEGRHWKPWIYRALYENAYRTQ